MPPKQNLFPAKTQTIWISAAIIIPIFTFALAYFFGNEQGTQNLDGSQASRGEVLDSMARLLFLNLPLMGFFLGLLVALIPYKGASYKEKYFRSSILSILILEALFFLITLAGSLLALGI